MRVFNPGAMSSFREVIDGIVQPALTQVKQTVDDKIEKSVLHLERIESNLLAQHESVTRQLSQTEGTIHEQCSILTEAIDRLQTTVDNHALLGGGLHEAIEGLRREHQALRGDLATAQARVKRRDRALWGFGAVYVSTLLLVVVFVSLAMR